MPERKTKAALPTFRRKADEPIWQQSMLQADENQSQVLMDRLIRLDTSSQVPLLEQLQRALNDGKVVARTLDLFREWDADKSGTVSRKEFARAMGVLGLEDLSVAEALFDELDNDRSGEIDYKEIHRKLRKSEGYTATTALWNAPRDQPHQLSPRSRPSSQLLLREERGSTLLSDVYDDNELPDIPLPALEVRYPTRASPRPQTESRAASPRWRSAHRTFSGWCAIGDPAGDMPTDWIGTSDWRRRARSKMPSSRATEQVGVSWNELCTGAEWTTPRANQLDTRPECLRHLQSQLPRGYTAAERLKNKQLAEKQAAKRAATPGEKDWRKLDAYRVPEASRFALQNTIPPSHDPKYVMSAMPVGVTMREKGRGGPGWGAGEAFDRANARYRHAMSARVGL